MIGRVLSKLWALRIKLAPVLLLMLATACSQGGAPAQDHVSSEDENVFGDPYVIVPAFDEGDVEPYPLLLGDSLVVRLTYSGGCETHDLDLRHRIERDTAFVWIFHQAHGDACEALVRDEYSGRLPAPVMAEGVVVLRHPRMGPLQVLREDLP